MNTLTRDDTEHGEEYVLKSEADAIEAERATLWTRCRDIEAHLVTQQAISAELRTEVQQLRLAEERERFLLEWLKRYGLLQTEFGQMGAGEKPENWWLLHAPWGIDKTRPFFGHGKTPEQAIDAAMLAAKEAK